MDINFEAFGSLLVINIESLSLPLNFREPHFHMQFPDRRSVIYYYFYFKNITLLILVGLKFKGDSFLQEHVV